MEEKTNQHILVGVNEKVSIPKSMILGLQHVLAMDLYIAPIIIAGLLSLSTENTSFFIQMCFLATGIATLIQTGAGIKLPVVQGPSYVPIGAIAAIGSKLGLGAIAGSLIPGALIITVLGYPLKVFAKAVRRFIPPLVGGTVIIIVGISLMPVGLNNIFYAEDATIEVNIAVGSLSAAVLLLCMLLGNRLKGLGTFFRLVSVIVAIVVGTIVASFFHPIDFSPVKDAAWFSFPSFFPFGAPVFDVSAIITMVFVYFIILIETTGTWFVVSSVTGEKLDEKRLNRASVGEGLGCFAGALVGSTPLTGYSSNAGLLAITGVASRRVIITSGIFLIFLGLMPKLSTAITCIPEAVINGIFTVVCVAIVTNGLKVIQPILIDDRNMVVIGVPILLTVAMTILPEEALTNAPDWVHYMLSSGITLGALAAVILNIIIPKSKPKDLDSELG